ncbi:glutamate--cysteine ligase [Candidatus Symbiobacter mobilis]|uniref:Glutamate--cysteine ligase n=1 Tax=Candidatus Symbiobacter mobilis CR TaxID=946483 RepID=U5NBR1_9BURK|nr:glutamate--cysteine ligase [Candidatus Symbiobacter mobilis]AGX87619.1 glutamate--cysteine ligase [Candidatus Symbiobacter mobilis CR]
MLQCAGCDGVRLLSEPGMAALLRGALRGWERECLRVDPTGELACTPHPRTLGAKGTHPWITTDYAEPLLEFITPPAPDVGETLDFLRNVHRYAARRIGDEWLWAGSMPCRIGRDEDIPIAHYGTTNEARFRQVYREGLGLRYGKAMQTIAGAHYNWSLPAPFWEALYERCPQQPSLRAEVDERYFGLVRNMLRFGWLVLYLFGASPAVGASFVQGRSTRLHALGASTLYGPWATSLRMSRLGYQNRVQDKLVIGCNSLKEYVRTLDAAVRTPDPYYATLGVREGAAWKQLSAHVLQTEAEWYAPIRPKRTDAAGLRPAQALRAHGVQYVEVRLLDIDPFIDIGVHAQQAHFLDTLLLLCLLRASPPISPREYAENDENLHRVAAGGRDPRLHLLLHNREYPMRALAHRLVDDMLPVAEVLDAAHAGQEHRNALAAARACIDDPGSTPSARVLNAVQQAGGHATFALEQARVHTAALQSQPLTPFWQERMDRSVADSLTEDERLHALPQEPFEDYVARYLGG